jgi:hypothetical protein
MTGVELDPVLAALDLPVNGTAIEKRQRLRVLHRVDRDAAVIREMLSVIVFD